MPFPMRLILYTQYYRARTPERQAELDHCLHSNLQHPMLDQVVLLREPDAPELPGDARMQVEVLQEAERLTYASWMRLLQQQPEAIGILVNSDIALGTGWEQLQQVLNTPESVVVLSRYNPQGEGLPARLNKFPHWTQDTWAMRSDAPIKDSLLYASGFPIGYPGCDNRIAYVLWSHGLVVKNPCYQLETLPHQADEVRAYDKNTDRLYGGVSYVHPSLSLAEPSELEHTLWTRARDACPGVLVNQQAVDLGVHQLLAKQEERAQQFLEQQKSTGLAWAVACLARCRALGRCHWCRARCRAGGEAGVPRLAATYAARAAEAGAVAQRWHRGSWPAGAGAALRPTGTRAGSGARSRRDAEAIHPAHGEGARPLPGQPRTDGRPGRTAALVAAASPTAAGNVLRPAPLSFRCRASTRRQRQAFGCRHCYGRFHRTRRRVSPLTLLLGPPI